jgi:16S rRNA (guanine966-N2)-methyltransferase
MLASRLGSFEDLRVADLFAGSGALGLEALSRGAAHACFVENDHSAATVIRRNAEKLGARIDLMTRSALRLPRSEGYDIIFADPPYAAGAGTELVRSVVQSEWLCRGGWMTVETRSDDPVDASGFEIDAVREFGRARLTLLRRP